MYWSYRVFFASFLCLIVACKTAQPIAATSDDGKIEVEFVQVNDVYEIAPVAGGREGGMARVATLKKQIRKQNSNTFLVMAGDFLSPSVYNSLQYNGKRIRGAQMVDAMNAAGMDLVVFGNHEFDISESELQSRINEFGFAWVASNTFHKTSAGVVPFRRENLPGGGDFPKTMIMRVKDADGTEAKIGYIGLTLSSNPAEFVTYKDPLATAKQLYAQLKDSVDAVVAITHQTIAADMQLARELPGLALIIGGHEHSGILEKVGNVNITKAQSNARTAYVIKLSINKNDHSVAVEPQLKKIDENIAIDSNTNEVVQKWVKIAAENYNSLGFDPAKVVLSTGETLDGRETETRNRSTNLTRLISAAMAFACPQADVVVYNSGSIRLDDVLTPPVTQYDIIRTLPFGGGIVEADMKGSLLQKVLKAGMQNVNAGGFLQYQPVSYNATSQTFVLHGSPLDTARTYRVAMTEFLYSGKEANLGFLNAQNADIIKTYPVETSATSPKSDIRLAIVKYLESKK